MKHCRRLRADCLAVPLVRAYIGKAHGEVYNRLAFQPPENRHDHRARGGKIGAEAVGGRAAHETVCVDVGSIVIEPVAAADIVKVHGVRLPAGIDRPAAHQLDGGKLLCQRLVLVPAGEDIAAPDRLILCAGQIDSGVPRSMDAFNLAATVGLERQRAVARAAAGAAAGRNRLRLHVAQSAQVRSFSPFLLLVGFLVTVQSPNSWSSSETTTLPHLEYARLCV